MESNRTDIVEKGSNQGKEHATTPDASGQENELYWRVRPFYSADFDPETGTYHARVELPGIPKEHVKLRVLPDLFDLRATSGHTQYILTEYFPYEMDVNSLEAKYEFGLLLIKGRFKDPLDSAVDIKVS